jgi:hypothetical protein
VNVSFSSRSVGVSICLGHNALGMSVLDPLLLFTGFVPSWHRNLWACRNQQDPFTIHLELTWVLSQQKDQQDFQPQGPGEASCFKGVHILLRAPGASSEVSQRRI